EFRAQAFVVEKRTQVQLIDKALHVALGRLPPHGALALLAEFSDALRAHLVALDRHDLHALVRAIPRQYRNSDRPHGREGRDRGKRHYHELWAHDDFDEVHHDGSTSFTIRRDQRVSPV